MDQTLSHSEKGQGLGTSGVDNKLREQQKRHWLIGSTWLNAALAAAKLFWALLTGSTVVLADAIHSLSDVLGALLVYSAVRVAPHHSKRFPLGLYKLEDMAAFVGGLTVLFATYEILRAGFFAGGVKASSLPGATLGLMVVIIAVQVVFVFFERRSVQKLNSPGLNSDVINWLGDIGAGLVVMAGVAGHMLGLPFAQQGAILIICGFLLRDTYGVLRDALMSLLDASAGSKLTDLAYQCIADWPHVRRVRGLVIRRAGSAYFLKATLDLDISSLEAAHEIQRALEAKLKTVISNLDYASLDVEPWNAEKKKTASLYGKDKQTLSRNLWQTAWVKLEDCNPEGQIINTEWVANPYSAKTRGSRIKMLAWLLQQHVTQVRCSPDHDPSDLKVLLDAAGVKLLGANDQEDCVSVPE